MARKLSSFYSFLISFFTLSFIDERQSWSFSLPGPDIYLKRLIELRRVANGLTIHLDTLRMFNRQYWNTCLIGEAMKDEYFKISGLAKVEGSPLYEGKAGITATSLFFDTSHVIMNYVVSCTDSERDDPSDIGARGIAKAKIRLEILINLRTYYKTREAVHLAFSILYYPHMRDEDFLAKTQSLLAKPYHKEVLQAA